ncbi:hypothetical protein MASR2M78_33230 [Treponema sp.]
MALGYRDHYNSFGVTNYPKSDFEFDQYGRLYFWKMNQNGNFYRFGDPLEGGDPDYGLASVIGPDTGDYVQAFALDQK